MWIHCYHVILMSKPVLYYSRRGEYASTKNKGPRLSFLIDGAIPLG